MSGGFDCVFEGLYLIRQPGLRRYVVAPLAINIVMLVAVIVFGAMKFETWTSAMTSHLPAWLAFLSWLVGLFAALLVILILLYLFTIVANIVAAPFNAILSEKVQERLTGSAPTASAGLHLVLTRSILRELAKLTWYLPRLLGLVIVTFIPGVNALAPLLWVIFGAWMMAVEYTDYAADNNEIAFSELRRRLGSNRLQALAFGLLVYVLLAIPFLNLVLIPAAVAGGTAFWVRRVGIV